MRFGFVNVELQHSVVLSLLVAQYYPQKPCVAILNQLWNSSEHGQDARAPFLQLSRSDYRVDPESPAPVVG